ncbi:MAG: hypothetical protein BAA00_16600 [Parageobacillus thermoglucosidasius]|nr:MAG: hypothetical protein BAA00_16600 [Parageobacillus thermoglucosidasius]
MPKDAINSSMFEFLRKNVMNVTDLVRGNKLSEILDYFSRGQSEEVFVVQNGKKKNAMAVIVDLEYFEQLLRIKEIIDESLDQVVLEEAYERANKPADLSLADVFEEDEINVDEIIRALREDEIS